MDRPGNASSTPGGARGPRERIRTPDFFEEKLSELRGCLGWSQAELGRFFGVSRASVSRWETRGVGETEARKAALRLIGSTVKASSAPARGVGARLLDTRVVGTVLAAAHERPRLGGARRADEHTADKHSADEHSTDEHSAERGPSSGPGEKKVDWKKAFRVRDRLGWTQAEFAAFLGVTQSVLSVWERPGGSFDAAVEAALLALGRASDSRRPEYPAPETPWADLKSDGLGAFYREVCRLEV